MVKESKKKVASSGVSTRVTTTSVSVVQRPPSWFHRDWLWGLILILFIILTYTPVWHRQLNISFFLGL